MEYTKEQMKAAIVEYKLAARLTADTWVPACGGLEIPAKSRNGSTYLYVYNHATEQHGWLNMETDVVETDNPFN